MAVFTLDIDGNGSFKLLLNGQLYTSTVGEVGRFGRAYGSTGIPNLFKLDNSDPKASVDKAKLQIASKLSIDPESIKTSEQLLKCMAPIERVQKPAMIYTGPKQRDIETGLAYARGIEKQREKDNKKERGWFKRNWCWLLHTHHWKAETRGDTIAAVVCKKCKSVVVFRQQPYINLKSV